MRPTMDYKIPVPVHQPVRLDVGNDVAGRSLVFVELLGDENAQLHAGLLDQPVHPELFVDQPGEAGRQRLAKVHRKRTLGVEPVLTPNIDTRVSVVIVIAMFG